MAHEPRAAEGDADAFRHALRTDRTQDRKLEVVAKAVNAFDRPFIGKADDAERRLAGEGQIDLAEAFERLAAFACHLSAGAGEERYFGEHDIDPIADAGG